MAYHERRSHANHRRAFHSGLLRAGLGAGGIVIASLLVGLVGFHHFANLGWVDSFYSASMIMSGMGPTETLRTSEAKIFVGIYALYSGLILLASAGIVLSPFMTRVLHLFHAEREVQDGESR